MGSHTPQSLESLTRDSFNRKNFSSTLATISSRLSYPDARGLVLVEGLSDVMVFGEVLGSRFHIINAFDKGKAIKVLENFDNSVVNLIAILDRDYDTGKTDARIFYYDFCNMEMMMISDDRLFNTFCNILGSKKKIIDYRDNVLNTLLPFQLLRIVNNNALCHNLHSTFKVKDVVNDVSIFKGMDRGTIINYICSQITNCNFPKTIKTKDRKNILAEYQKLISKIDSFNVFECTNGHDFNVMFIEVTGLCLDKKSVTAPNSIYLEYKKSYTKDMFIDTKLYKDIKKYEKDTNTIFI